MGSHGRFYAMQIKRNEGVASIEVEDDELSTKYIKGEDIKAYLIQLFRDFINNFDDDLKLLKILFYYRDLFYYISTFPKQNFFIDRIKFIESIESIKSAERNISLKVITASTNELFANTSITQPDYKSKVNKDKLDLFLKNDSKKRLIYSILKTFNLNLKLDMETKYAGHTKHNQQPT